MILLNDPIIQGLLSHYLFTSLLLLYFTPTVIHNPFYSCLHNRNAFPGNPSAFPLQEETREGSFKQTQNRRILSTGNNEGLVSGVGDVSTKPVEHNEAIVANTLQITKDKDADFGLFHAGEGHELVRALGTERVSAASAVTTA